MSGGEGLEGVWYTASVHKTPPNHYPKESDNGISYDFRKWTQGKAGDMANVTPQPVCLSSGKVGPLPSTCSPLGCPAARYP